MATLIWFLYIGFQSDQLPRELSNATRILPTWFNKFLFNIVSAIHNIEFVF